jgi:hypothetical protein
MVYFASFFVASLFQNHESRRKELLESEASLRKLEASSISVQALETETKRSEN